jgi:hypothetical protein
MQVAFAGSINRTREEARLNLLTLRRMVCSPAAGTVVWDDECDAPDVVVCAQWRVN